MKILNIKFAVVQTLSMLIYYFIHQLIIAFLQYEFKYFTPKI